MNYNIENTLTAIEYNELRTELGWEMSDGKTVRYKK